MLAGRWWHDQFAAGDFETPQERSRQLWSVLYAPFGLVLALTLKSEPHQIARATESGNWLRLAAAPSAPIGELIRFDATPKRASESMVHD